MKTGLAKATLGNTTLAETASWHEVEGNVYFPPESIKKDLFEPTDLKTICSWKGEASYYTVKDGDTVLNNAAWYYPNPKDAAKEIKDHVAFYKNKVTITTE
ncbi:hypothetical protein SAPIO_CDS7270 [Scedosporium apiospermum]|uniref:DUF427 domain-containing protein n=1 Tax=Pseudallescheria apiosperma TaxID=563466 RepID=A0A084G1H6_PSEDA|nr:uncharacterized protein SAPIO_CDS7270 [Scedosporium apiospermum]KEZ41188.1 hypothetical protein SAPIO_CDS7270 [Scedosporium apiospermum]